MERALSEAEMTDLLTTERYCHLGCAEAGKPYVFPLAYVFAGNALYGQTTEGKKIEILRRYPAVCCQIDRREDRGWRSVLCWGMFEELDVAALEEADARSVFALLHERLGGIQSDVGIALPSFAFSARPAAHMVNDRKSTLFRVVITEKTGRLYSDRK